MNVDLQTHQNVLKGKCVVLNIIIKNTLRMEQNGTKSWYTDPEAERICNK